MNWEIFGWCVASFIVLEVIFIIMLKTDAYEHWASSKLCSFVITGMVMLLQAALVFGVDEPPKYINLLWEFLVIVGIVLFVLLNYFLAIKFGKVDWGE